MTSDPDPDQRPRTETRRDTSKQTDRPNASFGALVYGGRSGLDGSLVAMLRLLITKSDSSCICLLQVVYRLELRLRHLLLWWHVGAARLGCSFGRHRGKMSSDHYSSRTVSTIAPLTSRVNDLFLAGLLLFGGLIGCSGGVRDNDFAVGRAATALCSFGGEFISSSRTEFYAGIETNNLKLAQRRVTMLNDAYSKRTV